MTITIDNESRQRIKSPIDIDFMGQRYRTENNLYTFTSPVLWTIEKNLFYLLKHSVEVNLEPKYIRKPWLLSHDQYGTVTLELLIMRVNGIFSADEFDSTTIVLPKMEAIIDICADKFSKKQNIDSLEAIEW